MSSNQNQNQTPPDSSTPADESFTETLADIVREIQGTEPDETRDAEEKRTAKKSSIMSVVARIR